MSLLLQLQSYFGHQLTPHTPALVSVEQVDGSQLASINLIAAAFRPGAGKAKNLASVLLGDIIEPGNSGFLGVC